MFNVHQSNLSFDETVDALTKSAQENGWKIPMVHDLQKNYQEAGFEDMTRATIVYFCNPSGGYRILKEDENKPMSVMMPMGVSVYETQTGDVLIVGMNLERMSMMFGDDVKNVLRESAVNYTNSMASFATPHNASDVEIDKKKFLLGCVSLIAGILVLLGAVIAIMGKVFSVLMPKMMATMMPKMMESMEKAGVEPPCVDMIVNRLEDQQIDE